MATHRPGELRSAARTIAEAVRGVSADGDYALELDPARLAGADVDVTEADPDGEITISAKQPAQAPAKSASA
jgi:hypothetical protein